MGRVLRREFCDDSHEAGGRDESVGAWKAEDYDYGEDDCEADDNEAAEYESDVDESDDEFGSDD